MSIAVSDMIPEATGRAGTVPYYSFLHTKINLRPGAQPTNFVIQIWYYSQYKCIRQ